MKNLGKVCKMAQLERKPWKQELNRFLRNYRATPHTTTGVAPATLLQGYEMRVKLPQITVGENDKLVRATDRMNKAIMKENAEKEGAVWAKEDDDRITRMGSFIRKTRIDELPQMWNVFKGEMRLVGPRPERPVFVDQLSKTIPYYSIRHNVKPGITGWAQVWYPYGASEKDALEKLEFDLYYMKNFSIAMDLVIILKTIKTVLFQKGAR